MKEYVRRILEVYMCAKVGFVLAARISFIFWQGVFLTAVLILESIYLGNNI